MQKSPGGRAPTAAALDNHPPPRRHTCRHPTGNPRRGATVAALDDHPSPPRRTWRHTTGNPRRAPTAAAPDDHRPLPRRTWRHPTGSPAPWRPALCSYGPTLPPPACHIWKSAVPARIAEQAALLPSAASHRRPWSTDVLAKRRRGPYSPARSIRCASAQSSALVRESSSNR